MKELPKHPQDALHPSEIVTLAFMFAIKGVGNRPFYRWLGRDFHHLFPGLPERTCLFRLFKTHRAWTERFLARPTVLGVIDSYGIELIHPIREGRSRRQYGRKWLSMLLTLVNHFKRVMHREWDYFQMRLAYTMAAFNLLVQWHGLEPDDKGIVHLSIAEFSL